MGLFTWIKRLLERADEDDLLEDADEPEVMTWVKPGWIGKKEEPSDTTNGL